MVAFSRRDLVKGIAAGVPIEASAVTINRFCSSGLQAIAFGAERIICGSAETIVAGGPNTALPHARPGNRRLAAGDLVLLEAMGGGLTWGACALRL